ncbi:WD repeat-containing protein 49-like isoform X3 [Biomphalaria glabrata]|uniref:WD repeat-containing protein 49-like isoform X3 n=1 Tax=Biomphalaria glabrata TaxID=6526 RepID=A0A9W2ZP16_BIOGL|nr:WD repeat-containing protein 49-like isoform X3 [Biomphalaria glabrata]
MEARRSGEPSQQNVRLEEHIKLQHLEQLMYAFTTHNPEDILVQEGTGYFPAKVQKRSPGCMNLQEFKDTIFKILGTAEYDEYLEKLFMKLDTSGDNYVDWNEFCSHLLVLYRENDYLRKKNDIPFMVEPKIRHIVHNKQEQTTKVVAVQGPVRYVTISKEGAMSVWQPNMVMEKHYCIADLEVDPSSQKRRFKMWVTDAVYMPNCQKVAIASTSRDIRFYDVSSSQYFEEYHLFAMTDVPYSFDYYYNVKQPNSESFLVFGVDTGSIHILTFHKPVNQLFENPFKNDGGVQEIFMQDLPNHSQWVSHKVLTDIHPELVRQVRYLPENEAIISSSGSPRNSLVICDVTAIKKSYVFKLEKAVECFDHNKNINLLVTGSGDHIVRLWNPYVTTKPTAVLTGHNTGVIGVAIHEGFRQVFSYSKEAVIKVWDIKEHVCLQTVAIKFPSALNGRMPEHGQFPVHLQGPPYSAFVVTCNDYIAVLRLGKVESTVDNQEVTHDTQLCSAIYNNFLKQVVTGCDSSTISVWDIETGSRSLVLANAHGDEEITFLAFDSTDRRLLSGARNGTVKAWNFQNGHNLHNLESVGEHEVTGILHLPDKKVILTVGWNQKIVTYDDTDPDSANLSANDKWKGGQLHTDDILTADFAPPNFLATASFDGEIIVWDVDTEKIYVRLRKGQPQTISKRMEALKSGVSGLEDRIESQATTATLMSRPNSRHRLSHKVEKGQVAPVDKLMFLKARASVRFTESAVLISSEAGKLRWWNISISNKEMGYFYVPNCPDESVLAMCSTANDSLLITGDTQGVIKCWNISSYCIQNEGYIVKKVAPLEVWWKAHDSAVVSVEYIQHDSGTFVLTASTDRTARLWSPEGHYIGTFGQKSPWNLKITSTWAHPKTPWSKEQDHLTDNSERTTSNDNIVDVLETASENLPNERERSDLKHFSRSGTESSDTYNKPTFLGVKVEKDLERRQRDRQGRRAQFGEILPQSTSQFGKQCSPYHALTTPTWSEVQVPEFLPLPQRMKNKGYSETNLTKEDVINMDFSFGLPDPPPVAPSVQTGPKKLSTVQQPPSRGEKGLKPSSVTSGRGRSSYEQKSTAGKKTSAVR